MRDDHELIRFDGRIVAVIAPEDLELMERQLDEARSALRNIDALLNEGAGKLRDFEYNAWRVRHSEALNAVKEDKP